jgi:Plasmid pRiA4b ORF-3-like protein
MAGTPAGRGLPAAGTVYRLRVVVAGISPLIWRRLEVPADTTIARLHAIIQTVFGWSGEHLHQFVIAGTEYGICYDGGPWFRDDARKVHLADLGLRERERFSYEYNFFAPWRVDLRVEQITGTQSGRVYPRCTGGRRAGPPEDWGGPWEFLERAQPYRMLDALVRAAEIMRALLEAKDADDLDGAGVDRDELMALLPLLGLERFDRRACNRSLRALGPGAAAPLIEGSWR